MDSILRPALSPDPAHDARRSDASWRKLGGSVRTRGTGKAMRYFVA